MIIRFEKLDLVSKLDQDSFLMDITFKSNTTLVDSHANRNSLLPNHSRRKIIQRGVKHNKTDDNFKQIWIRYAQGICIFLPYDYAGEWTEKKKKKEHSSNLLQNRLYTKSKWKV